MTDVPLPEPWDIVPHLVDGELVDTAVFDAEQLRSYAEARVKAERERAQAEVLAWRARFPQHTYRPQDDCVALRHTPLSGGADGCSAAAVARGNLGPDRQAPQRRTDAWR